MKRFLTIAMLLALVLPASAKTHHETYNLPCSQLWAAIKDTIRNSGKYGIISINDSELTASYNIGGVLTGKRINSVVLNSQGSNCEMQIQTAYSGIGNNDAGDFKKRVDESLARLKTENGGQPVPAGATEAAPQPAPPAAAQVSVASTPDGADIEIDGSFTGNTPSTIELTPGEHTVTVRKKGFKDWERKIKVTGGTINLRADLDPA